MQQNSDMLFKYAELFFLLKIVILYTDFYRAAFEHIAINSFLKILQIETKFGNVFKIRKIILHTKDSHNIVHKHYRDISKV